MRIVEPKNFQENKAKKQKRKFGKRKLLILVTISAVIWLGWRVSLTEESPASEIVSTNRSEVTQKDTMQEEVVVPNPKDTLRIFSDNEFKVFYENILLPNVERIENPPVITGNDIADGRIRSLAEARGYQLRGQPTSTSSFVSVEGNVVQPLLVTDWKALKAAAAKSGLQITLVSGHRSVQEQRQLFLERLAATGATTDQVVQGLVDAKIEKVLVTTSIPGYSKHHTGYTIDMQCTGTEFENFKNSPCQNWISADNYKVAKEHGFIPSYPPKADAQGPDPEAWEYVWVGNDNLLE